MATFRNPLNGYTQSVHPGSAFVGCLLFGVLYFAYKGVWKHALISLAAAFMTVGASWFVYPFFAYGCVRSSYLERGWKEVGAVRSTKKRRGQNVPSFDGIDV